MKHQIESDSNKVTLMGDIYIVLTVYILSKGSVEWIFGLIRPRIARAIRLPGNAGIARGLLEQTVKHGIQG